VLVLLASGCGGGRTRALSFQTDHFLCYFNNLAAVHPERTLRRGPSILLRDQFGTQKADLFQLTIICTPTRENSIPVRNARAHLACYASRFSRRSIRRRRVGITNEFDRNASLFVTEPDWFCLPTGMSLRPDATPRLATGLDHFQCYRIVRSFRSRHSLKLADEFRSYRAQSVGPILFCNPVSANHSPVANRREHLVCYALDMNANFSLPEVVINNQFGRAKVAPIPTPGLCVPSRERLIGRR